MPAGPADGNAKLALLLRVAFAGSVSCRGTLSSFELGNNLCGETWRADDCVLSSNHVGVRG